MLPPQTNFAFIDSQNVHLGIKKLGWKLDWKKFRIYLKEKYGVKTAYIFIGYIKENQDLYQSLKSKGYNLIFKETLKNRDGIVKGNCDGELILQAMIEYAEYEKAVIVTGDWDFACLVKYLTNQNKFERLLIPNSREYSVLLKKCGRQYIDLLEEHRNKLKYEKHPVRTEP